MNARIAIAGCGLSGMITALALAARNIPSCVFENRDLSKDGFVHDPRTTALNSNARSFFEEINIWSALEPFTGSIDDIYVVDNKSNDSLHFAPHLIKSDKVMGYIIENDHFKNQLFDLVKSNELIELFDNQHYELVEHQKKVLLQLTDKQIEAEILLVCNSHKSDIVKQHFRPKFDKRYRQDALVFNVTHEKPHECGAIEHFLPTGPFAILPMKDQHSSSIVWTVEEGMKNVLLKMSEQELTYNVQENFGPFLGEVKLDSKPTAFPLKAYMSNAMVNGRLVLLADSAHIIHPLAGQGLNQGIKDIKTLIDNIIIYGFVPCALASYQQQRTRDNMRMFRITDALNMVFSNSSKSLFALRKPAFKLIEHSSALKTLFMSYAMGDW